MCGIAGIVAPPGRRLAREGLVAASAALAHRGPDDLGFLGWDETGAPRASRDPMAVTGTRVGLAHRRLSILDLTETGWQPMSTPDGRFHVVFNGEIYNYRELRAEMESLGRRFVSRSDTEVLLAAHALWRERALERFVGMFAYAVLDVRERTLFLARDPFGIKPLYTAVGPSGFAFASEIRPALELSGLRAKAAPRPLYHYLRFGLTDHGEETLLEGIRQVPAAHYLVVQLDRPEGSRPVRYWDLDCEPAPAISLEEAASRLREIFLESVRLHLRSDVPVGAALSGGIDSSSIVLAMRHLEGDALDLHTVSYVADEPSVSEAAWIDVAGTAAKARMHRVTPSPSELVEDLERLIEVQGEPFGSTSIYAQNRVFRAAAGAGLKVMLDGQGADELLGGYRPYLSARLLSLLRRGSLGEAARFARAATRLPASPSRDLLAGLAFHLLPDRTGAWLRRVAGRPLAPPWLDAKWFRERCADDVPFPRARGRNALREQLRTTLSVTSLPMLLRYEDRNSMAYSIESRVPFLTPEIARFVLSLPEEYVVAPDATSKSVFRIAMRGIVPDAILERRDKIGFATPERTWLGRLAPWVETILGSARARAIPPLVVPAVLAEWRGVLSGERAFGWHVWRWINLVRWCERLDVDFDGGGRP